MKGETNFKIEHNQTTVLLLVEGELVIAGFAFSCSHLSQNPKKINMTNFN